MAEAVSAPVIAGARATRKGLPRRGPTHRGIDAATFRGRLERLIAIARRHESSIDALPDLVAEPVPLV